MTDTLFELLILLGGISSICPFLVSIAIIRSAQLNRPARKMLTPEEQAYDKLGILVA